MWISNFRDENTDFRKLIQILGTSTMYIKRNGIEEILFRWVTIAIIQEDMHGPCIKMIRVSDKTQSWQLWSALLWKTPYWNYFPTKIIFYSSMKYLYQIKNLHWNFEQHLPEICLSIKIAQLHLFSTQL